MQVLGIATSPDLIGNAEELGGVGGGEDPQTHDVGHGGVQEPTLGGWQNGNENMGP